MAKSKEPRSCGVILVCGDPIKSFLLMRHADRWDLPKGHVDPGETEIECALREMEEETGIHRSLVQLDQAFQYIQEYEVSAARYGGNKEQTYLKKLTIFLARVEQEHEIEHTEHLGSEWLPWKPPHQIQGRTIDPLLKQLEAYLHNQ